MNLNDTSFGFYFVFISFDSGVVDRFGKNKPINYKDNIEKYCSKTKGREFKAALNAIDEYIENPVINRIFFALIRYFKSIRYFNLLF